MKRRLMGSTALYSRMFLRAPDGNTDNGGDDGGNGTGNGNGGNQNQQQQQQQQPIPKADDDLGLDDIFATDQNDSNDEDFQLPDDDDDDGQESDEEKAAGVEAQNRVKASLSSIMDGFSIAESDIPDELGFADKGKAAEFMTTSFRKGLQSSLSMMLPVINHALTIATKQLDKKINSSVKQTGTQMEAQKAFSALGFTGTDAKLAKNFFNEALRGRKMTPQAAATATRNAMKALGKSGAPSKAGGQSNGNGGGTRTLQGESALNSFFNS